MNDIYNMKTPYIVDVKGDGHCGIRAFYTSYTKQKGWQNKNLNEILFIRKYLKNFGHKILMKLKQFKELNKAYKLKNVFKDVYQESMRKHCDSSGWVTAECIYALAILHNVNVRIHYVNNGNYVHSEGGLIYSKKLPVVDIINCDNIHYMSLIK
jgi:hypothetical protein